MSSYQRQKQTNEFVDGYLIHQAPYLEKKVRIIALTKTYGIVHAIGRQSQRKKQNGSILQPFTLLAFQLNIHHNLSTLVRTETQAHHCQLHPKALWAGMYINELIYRLCLSQDHDSHLFNIYQNCVHSLSKSPANIPSCVRQFEQQLLEHLGYALNLEVLNNNSAWYHYDAENGLQGCDAQQPGKIPRAAIEKLSQPDWQCTQTQQLCKHIFATAIENMLGSNALFITKLIPK